MRELFSDYRKKPVIVKAIQWDGTEILASAISSIDEFAGMLDFTSGKFGGFYIDTLEGRMKVSEGDYIIQGVKGEFYPCKPDIFELTYELAKQQGNEK
jgi:hypothetical protein